MSCDMKTELDRVCDALHLPARDGPLANQYLTALTPRRATRKHADSSERLEFLGDAAVHAVISLYLVRRYPEETEGFMSDMRAKMTCGASMASLAMAMGVGDLLEKSKRVSPSVELEGDEQQSLPQSLPQSQSLPQNMLEDAFEALAGAVLVNAGFETAYAWVVRMYEGYYDFSDAVVRNVSHKDGLLRYCRSQGLPEPTFALDKPQAGVFKCVVRGLVANGRAAARVGVDGAAGGDAPEGQVWGVGRGLSSKQATDIAAQMALEYVSGRRGHLGQGGGTSKHPRHDKTRPAAQRR